MKLKFYIIIFLITLTKIYSQDFYGKINDLRNMPWNNTAINNTDISGFMLPKGETIINHSVGSYSLNIPIYNIDGRLNVSLNYNPTSVKPNEHPNEAGLGWNLIAGGAVIREQRILADESYYAKNGSPGFVGGFFRSGQNIFSAHGPWGVEKTAFDLGYFESWDSPDKFHFNFLNYSGEFMIDEQGNWKVTSDSDFKVEHTVEKFQNLSTFNSLGDYDTIIKFKLTASDGTIFTFGGEQSSIDYTANNNVSFSPALPVTATKWNLTNIKFIDGNDISLQYQRVDPQLKMNVVLEYLDKYTRPRIPWFTNASVLYPSYISNIKKNNKSIISFYYKNSTEKKYWDTKIPNFPSVYGWTDISQMNLRNYNWQQWFNINSYDDIRWTQLDKITVTPLKIDYNFTYTANTAERLKLLQITKKFTSPFQKKVVDDEIYTLNYNANLLPEYYIGHGDHLGYNNGKNYSFVFTDDFLKNDKPVSVSAAQYEASRAADTSGTFLYAELLSSVKYPNGLVTKYEYEPNAVSHTIAIGGSIHPNSPPSYFNPGGFRLKSVSYYDNTTFLKRKRLKYQKFYSPTILENPSSGIMSCAPTYFEDLRLTDIVKLQYHSVPLNIFTSNGLHQTSNTKGSYILYSKVYEIDENENEENIGYTQYQFSNYDVDIWGQSHNDEIGLGIVNTSYHPYPSAAGQLNRKNDSYYNPINSNEIQRGKLLEKKIFDKNGTLLKETNYKYSKIGDSYVKQLALFRTSDTRDPDWHAWPTFLLGGFYKGYTYKYIVTEENNIDYFQGNKSLAIKKTFSYSSSYPNNLMFITEEGKNSQTTTNYQYAGDQNIQELISNNIISTPLMQEIKKNNYLTYKHQITYGKDASTNNLLLPKVINYYDINNIVKSKSTIDLYDERGNILQYRETEYSLPITIIWGYNKQHPILKINGATYEQVKNYVSNAVTISDNIAMSGNIPQYNTQLLESLKAIVRNPNMQDFVTTGFTYDYYAGVTNTVDSNFKIETYEYDKAHRLINILNNNNEILKNFIYNYKK